jgi:hypothetical protein
MKLFVLTEVLPDTADVESVKIALRRLADDAKMILHDSEQRSRHPELFEAVERNFLAYLSRLAKPMPSLDVGTTIVQMLPSSMPSGTWMERPTGFRMRDSVPPASYAFYCAECSADCLVQMAVQHIECFLAGCGDDIIHTIYEPSLSSHRMAMGNFNTSTGLVARSTAMAFDGDSPQRYGWQAISACVH